MRLATAAEQTTATEQETMQMRRTRRLDGAWNHPYSRNVPANIHDEHAAPRRAVPGKDADLGRDQSHHCDRVSPLLHDGTARHAPTEETGENMISKGAALRTAAGVLGGLMLVGVGSAAFAAYPDPTSGSDVDVNVDIAAVENGALSLTVDANATSLTETGSTASHRQFTGTLPNVTVTDTRTDVPAGVFWYVTGQASSFVGATGQPDITADHLGWAPALVNPANGDDVVEGPVVDTSLDTTTPNNVGLVGEELLALNLSDSQTAATAGQWTANAGLVLKTSVDVAPGAYTSTLTLSLFEDAL